MKNIDHERIIEECYAEIAPVRACYRECYEAVYGILKKHVLHEEYSTFEALERLHDMLTENTNSITTLEMDYGIDNCNITENNDIGDSWEEFVDRVEGKT